MTSRHIIFDLDGTLVDSALHCAAILSEMLEQRGSPRRITRGEAMPHMSFGGSHLVAALLAEECGDPNEELLDFRARYSAMPTPETCLYPGVRMGLAELAASGLVLGLCSNKPQGLCDKIVDELGLRACFTSVVGTRPDLQPKPDRAMLDLNLKQMDATPSSSTLVGDSEVDHALAAAAGLPFWLVTYGYAGTDWTARSDATFDRFDAVVAALVPRPAAAAVRG